MNKYQHEINLQQFNTLGMLLDSLEAHFKNAIRNTVPTDAPNQTLGIFLSKLRNELFHSQIREVDNRFRCGLYDSYKIPPDEFDELVKNLTKPRHWEKMGEMYPYALSPEYKICGYTVSKQLIFNVISKLKPAFNTLTITVSKLEPVTPYTNQQTMNSAETKPKFDIDLTNEKNALDIIGNSIKNLQDNVLQASKVNNQMGVIVSKSDVAT